MAVDGSSLLRPQTGESSPRPSRLTSPSPDSTNFLICLRLPASAQNPSNRPTLDWIYVADLHMRNV